MPLRYLFSLVVLLLVTNFAQAQQSTNRNVNVRAELARNEITIGDQIYLDVNISAPPGTKVLPLDPAVLNAMLGVEVIKDEELRTVAENPELLLEQRLLITSFDTGYVTIQPLPIYYEDAMGLRDTAFTTDFLLTVRGAVVSAEDDILPIKPIIEEPRNLLDYWWVLALLGLLLVGLGYREYRRRRAAPVPTKSGPPPPAHARALTALDNLEAKKLWQAGRTDAYYVELTRILRTYLEERFDLPALEMTTRQITQALSSRSELNREQRDELSKLLQLSDLVKFAKATPAEDLHPRGLQRVRDFVRETTRVEAVSTEKVD